MKKQYIFKEKNNSNSAQQTEKNIDMEEKRELPQISRARQVVERLNKRQDMLIYQEIMGKPKALQPPY